MDDTKLYQESILKPQLKLQIKRPQYKGKQKDQFIEAQEIAEIPMTVSTNLKLSEFMNDLTL